MQNNDNTGNNTVLQVTVKAESIHKNISCEKFEQVFSSVEHFTRSELFIAFRALGDSVEALRHLASSTGDDEPDYGLKRVLASSMEHNYDILRGQLFGLIQPSTEGRSQH